MIYRFISLISFRYDIYNKTGDLTPLYNNYLAPYSNKFTQYIVEKDENNDINMTINLTNQNDSSNLINGVIGDTRNSIRNLLSFYQRLNSYDNSIF